MRIGIYLFAPIPGDANNHLVQCSGTILLAKRLPSNPHRRDGVVSEMAAANDSATLGCVKFEEERCAGVQTYGSSTSAGLPEVDFVQLPRS